MIFTCYYPTKVYYLLHDRATRSNIALRNVLLKPWGLLFALPFIICCTFFHDDSPASGALVTIENEAGEKILSEKTDKEGKLQAPAPLPGKYKILVNDGAGHLSSTSIIIPKTNPEETNNQNLLISKSPDRNQFIQTPWLGIAVGLATIAVLGFIASRLYQNPKSHS